MAEKTIGQAYRQILPSMKGIGNRLAEGLPSETDPASEEAGMRFGGKMALAAA